MKRLSVIWCMCLGLVVPSLAWAQHEHPTPQVMTTKMIGTVDFQTSCKPAVKDDFNRAVALLHSFWFPESRAMFEEVLKADPNCAIAYWGIALTHWGNPFGGQRAPQTIANGKAAIDKGQATGSPTPREKGYIDAVAGLFSSSDVTTQRARVVAYEGATELIAAQNPKRRRGADLLGAGDRADRAADRQDLRAEPAGRGNPRADVQEDAEPSRPGALHHPFLRRAGLGRQGIACGARLRGHRTVGAPRAPHALAYLHARWCVEGIGGHEHSLGDRGREERWRRRSAARDGLRDVRLPADGHGQPGQGGARSRDDRGQGPGRPSLSGHSGWRGEHVCDCRDSGTLRDGTAAMGRCREARAAPGAEHALHRSDHALRARHRRRAIGQAC